MSAHASDEVALDFQDSLQDLQNNNRYEISNLTIIAKENTEHAQAISEVLEKHIKTTAPSRKLPALYVLDSIVKNVGSPYTIYLSGNLYSTFMGAYTQVGNEVRRNMDAMLKTWKEPVPGSSDPTPVFPIETTRPIENALIKFRTLAVQQQQQTRGRGTPLGVPQRPESATFRNTPTPPQNGSRYPPPPGQHGYQNGYPAQNSTPQPFTPTLPPDTVRSLSALLRPQESDANKLKSDIQGLIASFRDDFARSPFDTSIQSKLKALLDLQGLLNTQTLPPQALDAIKTQVAALQAAQAQSAPSLIPPQVTPQWQPPTPMTGAPYQPPPLPQAAPRPVAPALPNFAPGVLEQLLKSTAAGPNAGIAALPAHLSSKQNLSIPSIQSPRPASAVPVPPPAGNALIDALRAAGLVQAGGATPPIPTPQPPQPTTLPPPTLLQQLQGLVGPPIQAPTPSGIRIPLQSPNLKLFRPELVASLYSSQPNQCTTCGRRFLATEAGRAKKARHLDWHFRTTSRMADAVHKGQNRSWYLDEMEWIELRDVDTSSAAVDGDGGESEEDDGVGGGGGGGNKKKKKKAKKNVRDNYITAPVAAAATQACPICQERFETVWHDEAQEWVWMDAVRSGGRVYHASCHEEVSKAGGSNGGLGAGAGGFVLGMDTAGKRSVTPEGGPNVLGKRKAEGELLRGKGKRETVAS